MNMNSSSNEKNKDRRKIGFRVLDRILNTPYIFWVLLCFFVVFFAYFILPTYLNDYHEFRLFTEFPKHETIGYDLTDRIHFSQMLLDSKSPYDQRNFYPPLQSLFTIRFALTGPNTSFIFMTLISFVCFLLITALWPYIVSKDHHLNSLAVFVIFTGLYSLGFWFELESGQFNLFAMLCCFGAIYLFHRFPKMRWLAYILFIISVNLKIYPGIFVVCFTEDWHSWKKNLLRWGLLLLGCFACLFVLGWKVFLDFLYYFRSELAHPSNIWVGNHSIESFTTLAIQTFKGNDPALFKSLLTNQKIIQYFFLLIYAACLIWVWLTMYKRNIPATDPTFILILTIGAMIIPATSHDFKLSILAAPVCLLFNQLHNTRSGKNWLDLAAVVLLCLTTLTYSATIFVHTQNLPLILQNNFPALMVLLLSVVLLFKVQTRQKAHSDEREIVSA